MSLDLTKVVAQVGEMVARLIAGGAERQQRLDKVFEIITEKSADIENLKKKIDASKTTWLVAVPQDALDRRYQSPSPPDDFTVIASDGSHIDVDRHRSARCYLINIGAVTFNYGANSDAALDNFPRLYAGDDDMVITPPGNSNRRQPIAGPLLGIKRGVDEVGKLSEMAVELPKASIALALLDGSLILWGLEAYPDFVTETLLNKGFIKYLEAMKDANCNKQLALASYISLPRGGDVINILRVALCPNDPLDTDWHCPDCQSRECDAVAGVRDFELFQALLADGERSALFASQSSVVKKSYGEHRVHFFYLRSDEEIARVEIPQWVAQDENLLDLTHSLVLDQCRRGHGYPVALSEAHEQAVLTMSDRENFWQLVEASLIDEHLPTSTSGKSFSKRTRWV